jgi:hypothetical protein
MLALKALRPPLKQRYGEINAFKVTDGEKRFI